MWLEDLVFFLNCNETNQDKGNKMRSDLLQDSLLESLEMNFNEDVEIISGERLSKTC